LPYVSEERGEAAGSGVKIHDVIDTLYQSGMEAAVAKSKELGNEAEFTLIPSKLFIQLDWPMTECVFDYNLVTGQPVIHGRGNPREIPRQDKGIWTRGVADLVGWKDGVLHVVDWKSGRGHQVGPKENWQLIVTALAFPKGENESVNARIVKTTSDEPDVFVYTPEFLSEKRDELAEFAKLISGDEHKTRFKTGEHCKYCPSWVFCPAQRTAIERAAAMPDLYYGKLDNNTIETAINNVKEMDDLSVKAKKKIREYIELIGGEFKLSNGVVLIPGKTPGTYKRK
jgi:hypothetical protein